MINTWLIYRSQYMMELFSRENDTISNKKASPPGLILLLLLIGKRQASQ
jgi:hypothetical protein